MGLYDNLTQTNTGYISQNVGLPLAEFERTNDALDQRYRENLANASRLEILNNQRRATLGDTAINDEISQRYDQVIKEIAASGNYENASGKINALATKYASDKERLAVEDTYNRFQQEQALAQEMRAKGLNPLGLGDSSTFQSINPDTGEIQQYNSRITSQLDYDKAREKLFNQLQASTQSMGLKQVSAKYFGGDEALAEAFLQTGSVRGISQSTIDSMIDDSFERYRSTPEYAQQVEYASEVLGTEDPVEIDNMIKDQIKATGREKVFKDVDLNYIQNPLVAEARKAGPSDPTLIHRLYQRPPGASDVQKEWTENIPTTKYDGDVMEIAEAKALYGEDYMKHGSTLEIGGPNVSRTVFKSKKVIPVFDQLTKSPEMRANYPGMQDVYIDYMKEQGMDTRSTDAISKKFADMDATELKFVDKTVKARYKSKMASLSANRQYSSTFNFEEPAEKRRFEQYKMEFGLHDKDSPTLGTLPNYQYRNETTGKAMNIEQLIRQTTGEWGEGKLDDDDIIQFKNKLSFNGEFALPTGKQEDGSLVSSGPILSVGQDRWVAISGEENRNPADQQIADFGRFISEPTNMEQPEMFYGDIYLKMDKDKANPYDENNEYKGLNIYKIPYNNIVLRELQNGNLKSILDIPEGERNQDQRDYLFELGVNTDISKPYNTYTQTELIR